jgi:hypothetical protein
VKKKDGQNVFTASMDFQVIDLANASVLTEEAWDRPKRAGEAPISA